MSDQNPGQPSGQEPFGQQPYGTPPPPPSYGGGQEQPAGQQPYQAQTPYQQPYAQQQQYGGQYGGGYPMAPKTNTLAIVSIIASVLNFFLIPVLGSIVGVITGHMSLRQIRNTGEGGAGLAKAGLIVGYIGLALLVLAIIAIVVFAVSVPWEDVSTTY